MVNLLRRTYNTIGKWFSKNNPTLSDVIPAELDVVASGPITESVFAEPVSETSTAKAHSISGNAGIGNASVILNGPISKTVVADSEGFYSFLELPDGAYIVKPSAPTPGHSFLPETQVVVIDGQDVTANFLDPSSVVDSRNFGNFPNLSINVQGTLTYTTPKVDSRTAGAPIDSRASGKTVDSRVSSPQNSRA